MTNRFKLTEDGVAVAPTNSVGGGNIAGAAGDPPGPATLGNRNKPLTRKTLEDEETLEEGFFDKLLTPKFQYHSKLKSDIWDKNDNMKPEVTKYMINVAKIFVKFMDIPESEVKDVLFLGSYANFNYVPPGSDIDLHVVVSPAYLASLNPNHVKALNKSFNLTHKFAKLYGIPVELFLEDGSAAPAASSIYSVLHHRWIKKPVHNKPEIDHKFVNAIFHDWYDKLDKAFGNGGEKGFERGMKVFMEILKTRRAIINAPGGSEYAPENLAFKALRRSALGKRFNDAMEKQDEPKFVLKKKIFPWD